MEYLYHVHSIIAEIHLNFIVKSPLNQFFVLNRFPIIVQYISHWQILYGICTHWFFNNLSPVSCIIRYLTILSFDSRTLIRFAENITKVYLLISMLKFIYIIKIFQ